jgi:predicted dehydrogenase
MSTRINRRQFVATGAAGLALATTSRADDPVNKLTVGIMGTGGRGTGLAQAFAKQPGVEVAYVCDVDKKRAENAAGLVAKIGQQAPKAVQDFRKVLDDCNVDILVVATCNHWHAPAAILACAAGKHVYVEKPVCHNPREGELLIEAAKKAKKKVQVGNQRRSWDKVIEAIEEVRKGTIGRAYFAEAWYASVRGSIGKGKATTPPADLDYDLWQGPAPRREFRSNYLPYTWHWFWHWGNGELGNNGIHMLDLCRWGLGVDFPIRVTSTGGRYRYDDDQETPDTHVVTYDFADKKSIMWQGYSCNQLQSSLTPDVVFVGEKGSLAIRGDTYTVFDNAGKEVKKENGEKGKSIDALHLANFLDAIRSNKPLNSNVEEAHKSTLLCHLGNAAYRVGRSLRCEPSNGHILDDKQAQALWTREYEKGWEPKV